MARLLPVPCSTNTGRRGKAPVAPAALSAAAEWQRSSGHRSPRSTSIETYSSTRPSVSQASASGHACIGRGEGDFDTARPRLSTARKEARVASASAALPYLALRAASSAGVGGGLRGALAMRHVRPETLPRARARLEMGRLPTISYSIHFRRLVLKHTLYYSGNHSPTATVHNPQTILTHRLHATLPYGMYFTAPPCVLSCACINNALFSQMHSTSGLFGPALWAATIPSACDWSLCSGHGRSITWTESGFGSKDAGPEESGGRARGEDWRAGASSSEAAWTLEAFLRPDCLLLPKAMRVCRATPHLLNF